MEGPEAPRSVPAKPEVARDGVDVFLGYSSNIDHAGVTIPHQSLEMFTALELDVGLSVVVSEDP